MRNGRRESELVTLVREEVAPHFGRLTGCIRLGLLRIEDTRSYLALQYWIDSETWQETTSSVDYEAWLREYEPILDRWNEIMTFEDEWECEDIAGPTSEA